MIAIQLRGTSGSGKTTAMRAFMGDLGSWEPRHVIEGRRKPSYYARGQIAVLGHYESPCGGCDTFKGYAQLQEVVRSTFESFPIVLMEGLMLSDDVLQTVKIHEQVAPVRVLYLNTPIDTCIARVKKRRAEKGRDDVFNEEKLRNRQAQIDRTRPRLEAAGILCRTASADQVVRLLNTWIRLHANP